MESRLENCRLIRNLRVTDTVYDIELESGFLRDSAQPGQFVQLKCGDGLLLRRPISVCDRTERGLRLLYEVRGEGTRWLAELEEGAILNVLGPLGHGFTVAPGERVVLVGGGIGVFPLLYCARTAGRSSTVLLGYRNRAAVTLEQDFRAAAGEVAIATDDGSYGTRGFVTTLLEERLAKEPADRVLACGPEPMLKAVAATAARHQVPCEISAEARMGCGFGACLGCAIRVRGPMGGVYRHVCKDGPVFDAADILFE